MTIHIYNACTTCWCMSHAPGWPGPLWRHWKEWYGDIIVDCRAAGHHWAEPGKGLGCLPMLTSNKRTIWVLDFFGGQKMSKVDYCMIWNHMIHCQSWLVVMLSWLGLIWNSKGVLHRWCFRGWKQLVKQLYIYNSNYLYIFYIYIYVAYGWILVTCFVAGCFSCSLFVWCVVSSWGKETFEAAEQQSRSAKFTRACRCTTGGDTHGRQKGRFFTALSQLLTRDVCCWSFCMGGSLFGHVTSTFLHTFYHRQILPCRRGGGTNHRRIGQTWPWDTHHWFLGSTDEGLALTFDAKKRN